MPRLPKAKVAAREFAVLYVNGPEGVKGNWQECERRLGRLVGIRDEYVKEMIIAEGGFIPDEMPVMKFDPEVTDLDLSQFAVEMQTAETEDDWRGLAKNIAPTALGIMRGEIKASAAQTALIKTIWDRAYGKVSATKENKVPAAGILILPTLGERSQMGICPKCRHVAELQYPKEQENAKESMEVGGGEVQAD